MADLHVAIGVLCGTVGGPATYGRRLVEALSRTDGVRVTVLTDRPAAFPFAGVEAIDVPMHGGVDRLRWQHVAVPRQLRRIAPDVYHDTKNALPSGLRVPAVVTVHDLAYHTVPDTFGWASRLFLRRATRHAVRRARAVVVPSLATAADIARFHPECSGRVHVVPHGIDVPTPLDAADAAERVRRLGLPEPYVLHVGTVQARKNVDLVVAGVRQLRSTGLPHRAVIVGRRGWLAGRAVAEIERDDTAVWLEHVDDGDLRAIYARAAAFCSPSAYEGFGFTVADALAAGVPTVIADVSSLPELCGDAAVRLEALSADAVAAALRSVLEDRERSAGLGRRGRERAAGFSWQAAAAGHVRAYRAALG